ncbi:SPFH domain-containing protein [Aeromicrobium stalagmiti]|uniref:SPFH domain-containing protein n=1 Tax=Aeromicrobium stalagmiti TaxID=2738988 RepID=UPI001569BF62|nr:SPFH domain-containing protein [Aeromicrobium stalagmiti]NRQ50316.1 slipin family protein [Aeromicrobium stalagmiti]
MTITVMRHERVVHYRHGALVGVLEPGRHRIRGRGHTLRTIDTRVRLFEVRPQEIPTADGVTVKVSAAAQVQVADPVAHLEHTADPHAFLYDAVKAWLRETVHALTLDEVVAGIRVDETPLSIAAAASAAGYTLTDFGVRDVVVPAEIRRATEELVTAQRQAQVALERARSEVAVLRAMANSAKVLEDHPLLATLRLAETAASHGGQVIIERPTA